ncbi:diacylglycerol/lipid kinase family protein [Rhizohabitans arisaemae]|uniref:diacylglycerol/lipid kinase family protein n=1 Tax=Rhizohabitans arisaemae TaxID=2720610 RepID=UPI0024B06EA7|nr:YegS/Rv2252/BmrU family lipid kinase [Rhizohabitans arisaemae]
MRSKAEHTAAIREHRRAVVVINTHSRRGRHRYYEAVRLLDEAGFNVLESSAVVDPRSLTATLERALALRPDLLIVGGGDGSLSEAVKRLAHTDVALGVLPLGTTNNFARSLGLPLTLPGAIRVLTHGKVADVDVGAVDDHLFANLASCGVSVEVATNVKPWLKRIIGRTAYPLTALALLPGHRPFRAIMTVDGKRHELLTHQLNIANGRFYGGRLIARDISIDNRTLVAYQLGSGKRLRLLAEVMFLAFTGRRRNLAGGPFLTARELHLETFPPLAVDLDGEVHGMTPVHIRSLSNALRVMVPPGFVDT